MKNLATVQMGYSFRARLETVESGSVAVIQMKDLLDNNTVGCDALVKIDMKAVKEHQIHFFDRSREGTTEGTEEHRKDVLFIGASREFVSAKNQNTLSDEHIDKITRTYKERKEVEKYTHVADFKEIKENDFNLNIPRYVDTKVRTSQLKAAVAVNSALLEFYWELGADIVEKQKNAKWGSGFLNQLSRDLIVQM